MKVHELIELLKRYDQNLNVTYATYTPSDCYNGYYKTYSTDVESNMLRVNLDDNRLIIGE